METTKMTNFTCHSKSFINIFSTCQVSACEQQPFSCHNLANDIYSETAKTVFGHLNPIDYLLFSLPSPSSLVKLPISVFENLRFRPSIRKRKAGVFKNLHSLERFWKDPFSVSFFIGYVWTQPKLKEKYNWKVFMIKLCIDVYHRVRLFFVNLGEFISGILHFLVSSTWKVNSFSRTVSIKSLIQCFCK